MLPTDYVYDYFNKLYEIVNELKSHGKKMKETSVVKKIMRSLPQQFVSKVSTLEESPDLDTMTIRKLQSILGAFELKLKGFEEPTTSNSKTVKEITFHTHNGR